MTRTRLAAAVLAGTLCLIANPSAQTSDKSRTAKADDRTIVHVLNRLGFGPSSASIARVREMGIDAYINQQLQPSAIPDAAMAARLERLTTLTKSTTELAEDYFLPAVMERRQQQRRASQESGSTPEPAAPAARTPEQMAMSRMQRTPIAELTEQKLLRAIYSERQLEEALVDFWFNHFNVFVGKGVVRFYLTEYERDVIRPHVFGKFRDLLGATAKSPAMLFYLDNFQSTAPPDARTMTDVQRRGRRQAFVRPPQTGRTRPGAIRPDEVQPQAQAPRPRRGLNENYARELMELHTIGVDGGYTQKDVQEIARAFTGWTISNPRQGGEFRFEPRMHDDGDKVVLGHRIKAGGGQTDGERVLDLLAAHPSTARFIATKLVRRFVADTPPPALVAKAAERFQKTHGDIREVVRTIVTSPEFFAPEAYRTKVKTPLEFVAGAVRATDLDVATALPLVQAVRDLGMPLYGAQPPTGYVDRADAWINTGALLNRMNFAVALTGGQLRALRTAPAVQQGSAQDASDRIVSIALAGDISDATTATIARASTPAQAVALVLGSPEFQKR